VSRVVGHEKVAVAESNAGVVAKEGGGRLRQIERRGIDPRKVSGLRHYQVGARQMFGHQVLEKRAIIGEGGERRCQPLVSVAHRRHMGNHAKVRGGFGGFAAEVPNILSGIRARNDEGRFEPREVERL